MTERMGEAALAGGSDEATPKAKRRWRIRWTQRMKAEFLDHLASTCNVLASAGAIGVGPRSVYNLRRRDPAFRASWIEAVECGYEMLETQLIGHALECGGDQLVNGDVERTGAIDVKLALALLTAHRGRRDGTRGRDGPKPKVVTSEQTDASILRKLAAMARARAQGLNADGTFPRRADPDGAGS